MSLRDHIVARIETEGPLRVADYMTTCLLHPTYGYYATRDPFGQDGDFTTAPEISQMFGELIGLCLAQSWLDQGAPQQVALAELGPGRGTLMRDALRAVRAVPGFAPQVVLIEASAHLRDVQRATLQGHDVTWAESLDALPDTPLFVIANEFLDALPIRQFQRAAEGWHEICIGRDGSDLTRGLTPAAPRPDLAHRLDDTRPGDIVETNAQAVTYTTQIASHIAAHGGAALLVDYGDWRTQGDTWQAVQNHTPVDPLDQPGAADLTAHVDFEPLADAIRAAGAVPSRLTPQGVFLERLGITARAQTLAQNLTGDALDSHIAAHRRLTHPSEMGTLFKVMGIAPDGVPLPPGLEA